MEPTPQDPAAGQSYEPQPAELDSLTPSLPLEPPPPPPASTAHRIFFGRFGLRAGYGFAIWLVVYVVLSILGGLLTVAATGHLHELKAVHAFAKAHPDSPRPHLHISFTPLLVIVQDSVTFFGLLGVCWLFARGERRPLRAYGIGRYRGSDIIPGGLWGVVMLSAVVFGLRAAHLLIFDGRALHGTAILLYGLKWLFAFFLVGLAEEYGFRGYLQYTLMRGLWGLAEKISPANVRPLAFWLAATLLSLVFALAHTGNGGETLFGLLQVFLAGITFAYALWRTGSLWWGIGFHMTWDWAQSYLFGVADSGNVSIGRLFITHPAGRSWLSGGSDGPEGSVFASVALLLTLLIVHFVRPGVQPALEPAPKGSRAVGTGTPAGELREFT